MSGEYDDKMMRSEDYQDKTLRCVESDCQLMFVWTASEQKYFAGRMIKDERTGKMRALSQPKRCPDCRAKRKQAGI